MNTSKPPVPHPIEAIDGVWLAPLTTGTVAAFELALPRCFGVADDVVPTLASLRVETPGSSVFLREDRLRSFVGPTNVLPPDGPLLPSLHKEGRLFFGWLEQPVPGVIRITGQCGEHAAFVATLKMPAVPLPELSMPFKAGRWKAFNGPSAASRHRRAAVRIGPGKTFLMERFGIDWMRATLERPRPLNAPARVVRTVGCVQSIARDEERLRNGTACLRVTRFIAPRAITSATSRIRT